MTPAITPPKCQQKFNSIKKDCVQKGSSTAATPTFANATVIPAVHTLPG